jgi:hypothetical protein
MPARYRTAPHTTARAAEILTRSAGRWMLRAALVFVAVLAWAALLIYLPPEHGEGVLWSTALLACVVGVAVWRRAAGRLDRATRD